MVEEFREVAVRARELGVELDRLAVARLRGIVVDLLLADTAHDVVRFRAIRPPIDRLRGRRERVARFPEAQLDASRRDERVRVARVELRHLLEVPEGLLVLVLGEEGVAHPQEAIEVLGLLPQDGGEALTPP